MPSCSPNRATPTNSSCTTLTRSKPAATSANYTLWPSDTPRTPNRPRTRGRSRSSSPSYGASMADVSFASAIADAAPEQLLRLEHDAGHSHRFTDVDRLAASLVTAAFSGEKVIHVGQGTRGVKNADTVSLSPLAKQDRTFVDQTFALPGQQARGAWLLPEQASLKVGNANLASYLRHHPWHAITLATDDVARVQFASTADTVVAWALLIPLFDTLLAPVTTRAAGSTAPPEEQQQTWTAILQ